MGRTDRASRLIDATPAQVYAALVDPDALAAWLPPGGMTGRFEHFDARPGGSYRLILTYDDPDATAGKSSGGSDIVAARFLELAWRTCPSGRRLRVGRSHLRRHDANDLDGHGG